MADYLALADLDALVTRARVVQFLDDDSDGVVAATDPAVVNVLLTAEAMAAQRLLRAYPQREQIVRLMNADATLKQHVAWIACELASERRTEFTNAEGKGAYWAQYQRALDEIDRHSKGTLRSFGESAAGRPATAGGRTSARLRTTEPEFAVAPGRTRGFGPNGGQGGY